MRQSGVKNISSTPKLRIDEIFGEYSLLGNMCHFLNRTNAKILFTSHRLKLTLLCILCVTHISSMLPRKTHISWEFQIIILCISQISKQAKPDGSRAAKKKTLGNVLFNAFCSGYWKKSDVFLPFLLPLFVICARRQPKAEKTKEKEKKREKKKSEMKWKW